MVFWGFGESDESCESVALMLNQVAHQMYQHLVYKVHHQENRVNCVHPVLSCVYRKINADVRGVWKRPRQSYCQER